MQGVKHLCSAWATSARMSRQAARLVCWGVPAATTCVTKSLVPCCSLQRLSPKAGRFLSLASPFRACHPRAGASTCECRRRLTTSLVRGEAGTPGSVGQAHRSNGDGACVTCTYKHRANSFRNRPNLAEPGSDMEPKAVSSADVGPDVPKFGMPSTSITQFGTASTKFGPIPAYSGTTSTNFDQLVPEFGRARPEIDRPRPRLARNRLNLARSQSESTRLSARSGPFVLPDFDQPWQGFEAPLGPESTHLCPDSTELAPNAVC